LKVCANISQREAVKAIQCYQTLIILGSVQLTSDTLRLMCAILGQNAPVQSMMSQKEQRECKNRRFVQISHKEKQKKHSQSQSMLSTLDYSGLRTAYARHSQIDSVDKIEEFS